MSRSCASGAVERSRSLFIELIELLCCSAGHDESWLVAAIHRADGRVVLDGRLGCHVCGAQFPVRDGVAVFGSRPPAEAASTAGIPPDPWRIAALLDLRSPSGVVVLHGSAAATAGALLEMLPVRILAVNPAQPAPPREGFGAVVTSSGLPLRTGVATGIALGDRTLVAEAARVLRSGGRLIAPLDAEMPNGLEQLACDEREWVAVKVRDSEAIQITRGGAPSPGR